MLSAYSFNPPPSIVQVDAHQVNVDACCSILEWNGYEIVSRCWGDIGEDVYARYV